MMRRFAVLLALPFASMVAVAQESTPPAPPPSAPAPAEEAKPAEPAKPAESDDQVLERITGEMMNRIEELRGLKFKHDVKRVWKSRDEARVEMLAAIDKEVPPAKVVASSKEMAFFGLIPEGGNIKEIFSDFISAGAGGYYFP